MLQLQTIKKQIDGIYNYDYSKMSRDEKEKKQASNRRELAKLTPLHNYLLTDPREEFLLKEKARIENRIALLDKQFFATHKGTEYQMKEWKKNYDKLNSAGKLKSELATINYILTN